MAVTFGDARGNAITTTRTPLSTIVADGGAMPTERDSARAANACTHCGGRFGLVTHRWWGSKFCKRTCKDAYICEVALSQDKLLRWYRFLRAVWLQTFVPLLAQSR